MRCSGMGFVVCFVAEKPSLIMTYVAIPCQHVYRPVPFDCMRSVHMFQPVSEVDKEFQRFSALL